MKYEFDLVKTAIDLAASRSASLDNLGKKKEWLDFRDVLRAFQEVCAELKVDTETEHRCYQALLRMSSETEKHLTWWEKIGRIQKYFSPKKKSPNKSEMMFSNHHPTPNVMKLRDKYSLEDKNRTGKFTSYSNISPIAMREGEELSLLLNNKIYNTTNSFNRSSAYNNNTRRTTTTETDLYSTPNKKPNDQLEITPKPSVSHDNTVSPGKHIHFDSAAVKYVAEKVDSIEKETQRTRNLIAQLAYRSEKTSENKNGFDPNEMVSAVNMGNNSQNMEQNRHTTDQNYSFQTSNFSPESLFSSNQQQKHYSSNNSTFHNTSTIMLSPATLTTPVTPATPHTQSSTTHPVLVRPSPSPQRPIPQGHPEHPPASARRVAEAVEKDFSSRDFSDQLRQSRAMSRYLKTKKEETQLKRTQESDTEEETMSLHGNQQSPSRAKPPSPQKASFGTPHDMREEDTSAYFDHTVTPKRGSPSRPTRPPTRSPAPIHSTGSSPLRASTLPPDAVVQGEEVEVPGAGTTFTSLLQNPRFLRLLPQELVSSHTQREARLEVTALFESSTFLLKADVDTVRTAVSTVKILLLFAQWLHCTIQLPSQMERTVKGKKQIVPGAVTALTLYNFLSKQPDFVSSLFGLEQLVREKMRQMASRASLRVVFNEWVSFFGVPAFARVHWENHKKRMGFERVLENKLKDQLQRRNCVHLLALYLRNTCFRSFGFVSLSELPLTRRIKMKVNPALNRKLQKALLRPIDGYKTDEQGFNDFEEMSVHRKLGFEGFTEDNGLERSRSFHDSEVFDTQSYNTENTNFTNKHTFEIKWFLQTCYGTLRDILAFPKHGHGGQNYAKLYKITREEYYHAQRFIGLHIAFRRFYHRIILLKRAKKVRNFVRSCVKKRVFSYFHDIWFKEYEVEKKLEIKSLIAFEKFSLNRIHRVFRQFELNISYWKTTNEVLKRLEFSILKRKTNIRAFYMMVQPSYLKCFLRLKEEYLSNGLLPEVKNYAINYHDKRKLKEAIGVWKKFHKLLLIQRIVGFKSEKEKKLLIHSSNKSGLNSFFRVLDDFKKEKELRVNKGTKKVKNEKFVSSYDQEMEYFEEKPSDFFPFISTNLIQDCFYKTTLLRSFRKLQEFSKNQSKSEIFYHQDQFYGRRLFFSFYELNFFIRLKQNGLPSEREKFLYLCQKSSTRILPTRFHILYQRENFVRTRGRKRTFSSPERKRNESRSRSNSPQKHTEIRLKPNIHWEDEEQYEEIKGFNDFEPEYSIKSRNTNNLRQNDFISRKTSGIRENTYELLTIDPTSNKFSIISYNASLLEAEDSLGVSEDEESLVAQARRVSSLVNNPLRSSSEFNSKSDKMERNFTIYCNSAILLVTMRKWLRFRERRKNMERVSKIVAYKGGLKVLRGIFTEMREIYYRMKRVNNWRKGKILKGFFDNMRVRKEFKEMYKNVDKIKLRKNFFSFYEAVLITNVDIRRHKTAIFCNSLFHRKPKILWNFLLSHQFISYSFRKFLNRYPLFRFPLKIENNGKNEFNSSFNDNLIELARTPGYLSLMELTQQRRTESEFYMPEIIQIEKELYLASQYVAILLSKYILSLAYQKRGFKILLKYTRKRQSIYSKISGLLIERKKSFFTALKRLTFETKRSRILIRKRLAVSMGIWKKSWVIWRNKKGLMRRSLAKFNYLYRYQVYSRVWDRAWGVKMRKAWFKWNQYTKYFSVRVKQIEGIKDRKCKEKYLKIMNNWMKVINWRDKYIKHKTLQKVKNQTELTSSLRIKSAKSAIYYRKIHMKTFYRHSLCGAKQFFTFSIAQEFHRKRRLWKGLRSFCFLLQTPPENFSTEDEALEKLAKQINETKASRPVLDEFEYEVSRTDFQKTSLRFSKKPESYLSLVQGSNMHLEKLTLQTNPSRRYAEDLSKEEDGRDTRNPFSRASSLVNPTVPASVEARQFSRQQSSSRPLSRQESAKQLSFQQQSSSRQLSPPERKLSSRQMTKVYPVDLNKLSFSVPGDVRKTSFYGLGNSRDNEEKEEINSVFSRSGSFRLDDYIPTSKQGSPLKSSLKSSTSRNTSLNRKLGFKGEKDTFASTLGSFRSTVNSSLPTMTENDDVDDVDESIANTSLSRKMSIANSINTYLNRADSVADFSKVIQVNLLQNNYYYTKWRDWYEQHHQLMSLYYYVDNLIKYRYLQHMQYILWTRRRQKRHLIYGVKYYGFITLKKKLKRKLEQIVVLKFAKQCHENFIKRKLLLQWKYRVFEKSKQYHSMEKSRFYKEQRSYSMAFIFLRACTSIGSGTIPLYSIQLQLEQKLKRRGKKRALRGKSKGLKRIQGDLGTSSEETYVDRSLVNSRDLLKYSGRRKNY